MTELATLIEAMCQGTATYADRDRLEKLLCDPANRAEYLAATRLHSEFLWRWHRARVEVRGPRDAVVSPGRHAARAGSASAVAHLRKSRGSAAAFAGLVFDWLRRRAISISKPVPMALLVASGTLVGLLGIATIVTLPPPVHSNGSAVRWPAARITGLHEVKWRSPEMSFGLADPLHDGMTLDFESGLVEIRYECGATVVLEGPAALRVEGRSAASLSRGRLTAKLEKTDRPAAAGCGGAKFSQLFTIHTPMASVHDLGTEFGVDVRMAGDADVHVFDGLVEVASVGEIASSSHAAAFRLAAGDAATIDEAGRITATGGGRATKFVRTMPKLKRESPSLLERLGWSDAAAEVIYRDTFTGSGPLAGTTPASRGGIGNGDWIAQPQGWNLRDGSLIAELAGSSLIPFRPEPGWLYRLTVPFNVAAGSKGWCAIGFKTGIRPTSNHGDDGIAWMLRAHPSDTQHIQEVFAGSGIREKYAQRNRCGAAQTFSNQLDATDPRWRAHFLVDGEPVAVCRYSSPQTAICCVGISILSTALVRIDSFTLERAAKQQPGEPAAKARHHSTPRHDAS